jgi:hypothetical protein
LGRRARIAQVRCSAVGKMAFGHLDVESQVHQDFKDGPSSEGDFVSFFGKRSEGDLKLPNIRVQRVLSASVREDFSGGGYCWLS